MIKENAAVVVLTNGEASLVYGGNIFKDMGKSARRVVDSVKGAWEDCKEGFSEEKL